MDISAIMNIDVSTLAQTQYDALLEDTKKTLNKVMSALDKGDFEAIEDMVLYSGSGDCYGQDNHYIDFHCGDIMETVDKLKSLRASIISTI
jgi:uncharacterized protein (UPF0297 family)